MTRRVVTWGPVAGTVVAGALLIGAEPVAPRPYPPLPVPPVERHPTPPFLARITISGDPKMSSVVEECLDLAARRTSMEARLKAHPAAAPYPLTGCTEAHQIGPGGSIHREMSCDSAKGAKASFRMVSDGTPNDLRVHTELYGSAAGTQATAVFDSRMVRLGPCPVDLKPGQKRRPGGPVIETPDDPARFIEPPL
jgi:hypothetical protein